MRVDPQYLNTLTASLDASSNVENTLASQLSSGLRLTSLQDDPVAAGQSALLASSIAKDDTFIQTASGEASAMQVADSTLAEVVTQLTSAISIAVGGNSGTVNANNEAAIAQQLSGIRDQVLSLANTSYQGQHLFAGSQGSVQPFTLNTSSSPATVTYAGDSSIQYIRTPSGQPIQTNLPGSSLFGSGSSGVFGALTNLIADFSSGAPVSSTLTADTSALTASLGQMSTQRATLDSSLNRLQSTSSYIQTQEADLTVAQGELVSADPAKIASQLSSAETQHRALLSVISALASSQDLFDKMR
ncbi:MAG: flagellar hook-associated protein 3 [Acidobacteriota bacterium]|nr:flagellar hook-associated protein 3 [Acidobacteriota bacterium]